MAAAYGPQDKAVRAAYVASDLQRLGHGVADPGRAIARSLAALGLLAMGLSALVAPRHGFSLDHAVPQSSQANLSRLLMQCEITLHQRSEAETLLKAFTLVQMTRHYWGEFAGSLQDLGLSAGPQLLATVDRDAVQTRLWLEPHHGMEAYMAEVARSGGRLRIHYCRGYREGIGQAEAGHCPDGWQRISLK